MTDFWGPNKAVWVCAEIGVNHGGSVAVACQLIDAAVNAGAEGVKFQAWKAYAGDPYAHLRLDETQLRQTQAYAREKGITWFATPDDIESVDLLARMNVPLFKLGSAAIFNTDLLEAVGRQKKPVILSTGMADDDEANDACYAVMGAGASELAVLHCVSAYPTPLVEVNLAAMPGLEFWYGGKPSAFGWSSHVTGYYAPSLAAAAVGLGAKVLEFHLTLDSLAEGPDHASSLEPAELGAVVIAARTVELALGDGVKKPQPSEMALREKLTHA